ncbi:MAG TPA: hypothetical protein VGG40_05385 [Solirubrobacterales bacterium]|jgi:hypothetical protein
MLIRKRFDFAISPPVQAMRVAGPPGPKLFPVALAFAAVLLALAPCLSLPATADAGTYSVYYCRTPEGAAAPLTDWRIDDKGGAAIDHSRENCPGGPFELELSPTATHPANDDLSATVEAPAGTEIAAYKFWRSVQLGTEYGYRYRELTAFGNPELDICWQNQGCLSKGNPAQPFSAANVVEMNGRTGVMGLEFLITCALPDGSSEKCPASAPGAKFELFGAELTMADYSAPVLPVAPSGPLVTPSTPLSGWQPVTISATDSGGGVYQALLEVDGSIVQSAILDEDGGSCRPPFTHIAPCPPSATGTVWLNTSDFPDGKHTLRILVTDATGTNTAAWGPVTIETDNGRCNPSPPTDELDLHVGLVGRKHWKARVITTAYGHPLRIRGQLIEGGGKPVVGAGVCVAERVAGGFDELHRIGARVTNGEGTFAFKVPPGPSRRLYFIHRTAQGAVVSTISVRVRAPVSLHGSPLSLRNGQTLTMRGNLGSPPYPKRGALVELQAYRETGWQTFGTATTNRRGRFAFRYTFSRTVGLQHYLLRARVPKQADYPFESGRSRAIRVTVAG